MRTINKILVSLYFFVCPIEMALNVLLTSTTKYIGILLLVVWIYNLLLQRDKNPFFFFSKYIIYLFIWLMCCLLSLIWGMHSERTMAYLTTYLQMGLLVCIIAQTDWEQKEIIVFLHIYQIGCILMALLVFFNGGFQFSNRYTVLINGRYCDPNQVSANILPGVLVSVYYMLNYETKVYKRVISLGAFFVTTMAVLTTGSRGGTIGMIVSILLIMMSQIKNKRLTGISLISLIGIFYVIIQYVSSAAISRILELSNYTETIGNGGDRLTIWSYLLNDYNSNWIFGNGVGSSIAFFSNLLGKGIGTHNTFILVLYEVGIIGFLFFIMPYIGIIIQMDRKGHYLIAAIIICALTCSFFLDSLNLRYLWNGLIIGLIQYNQDKKKEYSNQYQCICKYIIE